MFQNSSSCHHKRQRRRRYPSLDKIGAGKKMRMWLYLVLLLWNYYHHFPTTTITVAVGVWGWKFRLPRHWNRRKGSEMQVEGTEVLANDPSSSTVTGTPPPAPPARATGAEEEVSRWFSWNHVVSAAHSASEAAAKPMTLDEEAKATAYTMLAANSASQAELRRGFLSKFVPIAVVNSLQSAFQQIKRVLLYKPPVGLVAVVAITRLIVTGRILGTQLLSITSTTTVEDVLFVKKKKQQGGEKRRGRSLILDLDDVAYSALGGPECVRRQLCLAALSSVLEEKTKSPPSPLDGATIIEQKQQHLDLALAAAAEALHVSSRPTGSWLQYIYEMVEPVARVERAALDSASSAASAQYSPSQIKQVGGTLSSSSTDACNIPPDQWNQLLEIAATTGSVRIMDAVLRLCRDRVLQTTYRLARTVEHWERRIKYTRTINFFFQRLLRNSIEKDRLCLTLAKAAYVLEVTRLGEIVAILTKRPLEMKEAVLIRALKATEDRACMKGFQRFELITTPQTRQQKLRRFFWEWTSVLSKYSMRWKADGKGFLSIRKFDDSDGYIDGPSALEALLNCDDDDDGVDWIAQGRQWNREARQVVCKVVRESLKCSTSSSLPSEFSEEKFFPLEAQWCRDHDQTQRETDIAQQWRSVVNYIDSSPSWRRVGEGEKVRLRDIFGLRSLLTRLDVLGIPSSLFYIYLASVAHERLVKPYGSLLRKELVEGTKKASEILQQRVWVPLIGIYDDIMNKSPGMMSALGLEAEETSLDHMLRDLNFGDGTPATRREALTKATAQYEHDLSSGLFANFARGRLVRLLLVQVQQLKVGLLSALDTIDVLIQGNRIHFQVLAAIPAVVITTFGTRYFFRILFNIRAKDLRPVTAVHHEMTQYLNKMENLLLLSDQVAMLDRDRSSKRSGISGTQTLRLKPSELGELLLNMHRYLILLDFSSPPFPVRSCDQIHSSLQQLFGSNGAFKHLDCDRQLQWLSCTKQKHQDLIKSL